jgi:8-oxo-dGTP pyrophosphatase MutT (NUDIX family)
MIMSKTCGILITNGIQLLICHPTGSTRWDIPKGKQDLGEDDITTAVRETYEETGIQVDPTNLVHLGVWPYRQEKQLSIFLHKVNVMPNVDDLVCYSHFDLNGKNTPEMDRYKIVTYEDALFKVNMSMRNVLEPLLKKQGG